MSVLIKGMKMPQEQPLRMVLNPNGQLFVDHGIYFDEYEAVEVTTPHGRLIDASEYINRMSNFYEEYMYDVLEEMPTIIEAEEGKSNG